ncbi:MAG TPA: YlmH/Sll1252 family protein [Bacilli bacterium]
MDLKIENLLKNGQRGPVLSKFLTPEEQKELCSKTINILFSETYPGEERKRAFLCPPGLDIKPNFRIDILEITAPQPLRHSDILGAALASGITREVLGDIIVGEKKSYLLSAAEITRYLLDNLTRIGRYNVEVKKVETLEAVNPQNYYSASIIVPGLRLDSILSKSLNLSRGAAQELIRSGSVKVNGKVNLNRDYLCKTDDLLSVTRFGRIIVGEITGKTKKDNIILNINRTR